MCKSGVLIGAKAFGVCVSDNQRLLRLYHTVNIRNVSRQDDLADF